MHWIAPSATNGDNHILEKRLWEAADQLRANSGLTSAQYSAPVLGLIFLRFADVRFAKRRAQLENPSPSVPDRKASRQAEGANPSPLVPDRKVRELGEGAKQNPSPSGRGLGEGTARISRRGSRLDDPAAYHAEGVLYLTPSARYGWLLEFPEGGRNGQTIGAAVNEAMRDIEKHNPQLGSVLPKSYEIFDAKLLKEILKRLSEIPANVDYDTFGRVYEYFLGEFARTEGQKGGEFYTPASIVRFMVEVIEPFHGRILDPACVSGGMFVQSARFVAEHKKNPASELAIHGQEKVEATVNLCRMNLAVHGLEGEIKKAISYYEDLHQAALPLPMGEGRGEGAQHGRFDFVLANPPFNVDAVDKDRLKNEVGPGKRYPFGLPRTDNGNYLWIQLFYSALNEKGRAGFVMANSASDARSSEMEIRKQLLQSGAVDVMVAVGPNMFYTVTLPCTLWFFDKGRTAPSPNGRGTKGEGDRAGTILFIDARHIYRQIDRAHREWTEPQIGFLANIVRLYRGEDLDFTLGGDEASAKIQEVFRSGLKSQISNLKYKDLPGLCKAASLKEIEAQGWSLNPGRYVGVAPGEETSDEDFKEQFEALNEELEALSGQARQLEKRIAANAAEILET